jgi:hypothetical protein
MFQQQVVILRGSSQGNTRTSHQFTGSKHHTLKAQNIQKS